MSIADNTTRAHFVTTLDGAVPKASPPAYSQPIQINSTTVVKAQMFYSGQLPGPTVTNTYFINEGFDQPGLPVLSLSSDPDYFFAADGRLYVQDFKPTLGVSRSSPSFTSRMVWLASIMTPASRSVDKTPGSYPRNY
ncbi:MAG: chitobiase/beta-hexosaminidase C-terminal domain-containing protein [Flammeovirgaceae bacterium]|nr:chitobiase/beta-hexosaminidase C-terminal domain-containing protein [Flammeovirgaceae bacterium]